MRLKKYAAAAMAAAMVMSMTVYGEEETSAPEETTEAVSEEEGTEEEAQQVYGGETEYPVVVAGSDGSEVAFEKEPETVVSLGPNITEIMYTLGAEDKLVARTDYCDYPEEVSELPSIGSLYDPDIEAILAMEPDLVVASTHISDEVMEQFTDAGIAVLYLYEEHDIKGVYDMIGTLGIVVNRQDAAAEAIDEMKEKIAGVEEALENLEEPVSVYYVVGFGEGGDYTAGGDTFINGILEAAGAVNIAADVEGWSYSSETLLEEDPDYVILPEWAYDSFLTTAPYSELTAVKLELEAAEAAEDDSAEVPARHVLTIDTNMLDRQCARNADAVVEIAQMLYPELFDAETETEAETETAEEVTESVTEEN